MYRRAARRHDGVMPEQECTFEVHDDLHPEIPYAIVRG
jgi:hypothetical protein